MMADYSPGGRTKHRPLISEFICQGQPELYFCFILYTHTQTHTRFLCRLLDLFCKLIFISGCILPLLFFFLLTSSDFLIHPIRRFLYSSFWSFLAFFIFHFIVPHEVCDSGAAACHARSPFSSTLNCFISLET